jgi:hypothetical protein
MNIIQRNELVRWHDILISQRDPDAWTYENAKMAGPSSLPAKPLKQSVTIGGTFAAPRPEIYVIKIGGTWAANDTLTIGATTFTAKSTTPEGNQFSAGGTGAVIVEDIRAAELTVANFTVAYSGDTIILTQTIAGTGAQPVCSSVSTAGTVVISNIQNYSAGDTITISETTYTCKSGASTASGTTEFEPTATPDEIVAIIVADPLTITGFTITGIGAKVIITQTVAGTGTALTSSDVSVSSSNGTATLATEQAYQAAISSGDELKYKLVPGDPVYLVSTDTVGVKTVAPVNATTSKDVSTFVGFVRDYGEVESGVTETVAIATGACRLDVALLPKKDAFGNDYDWTIAAGTIGKAASDKGFRFGQVIEGGR